MISLNSNNSNQRYIVVEDTECVYESDEFSGICGEITDRALNMPFDIAVMPLCTNHAFEYRDWTFDDTIREFVKVMTEEDTMKKLKENIDDDI